MFPKADTGIFALILFVWKFVMETFDADETEPGLVFNLHDNPRLLAKTSIECSHSIFKQVQWSPDGSMLLATSDDMSVYILPPDILEPPTDAEEPYRILESYTKVRECHLPRSAVWYPGTNLLSPETCCFLSSAMDQPIHLWDALTGKLRASYPLIDHREQYLSPHSMTFSNNAEDLICGTESLISIFSISNPGHPYTSISTNKLDPTSTKGIISALSISPDSILAAAKFNNSISLFSSTYEPITTFSVPHGKGITELFWSPDARYLYVVPRQSTEIEVWDIRSTGERISCLTDRQALTNQRIWTDLSADGKWFVSGGTDGVVKGWKTDVLSAKVEPSWQVKVHDDCVCSATLHPGWGMMATGSGSHHFGRDEDSGEQNLEDFSLKVWVFE